MKMSSKSIINDNNKKGINTNRLKLEIYAKIAKIGKLNSSRRLVGVPRRLALVSGSICVFSLLFLIPGPFQTSEIFNQTSEFDFRRLDFVSDVWIQSLPFPDPFPDVWIFQPDVWNWFQTSEIYFRHLKFSARQKNSLAQK